MNSRDTEFELHEAGVYPVPWGYQARCGCGWTGVVRAGANPLRDAKREADEHQRVPDRSTT